MDMEIALPSGEVTYVPSVIDINRHPHPISRTTDEIVKYASQWLDIVSTNLSLQDKTEADKWIL
jgi:hypothetical protein